MSKGLTELNDEFIDELIKSSLTNKNTAEILFRFLNYKHLPTDEYKIIWKEIKTFYELENKLPTIGLLTQAINESNESKLKNNCRYILANIKKLRVSNVHDELLDKFETYKKNIEFVELYSEVSELYKTDPQKAIETMAKKSNAINEFSIKDNYYEAVFKDFENRQRERKNKDRDLSDLRIGSGIHELDHYIRGGFKYATSFLALARSGVGKSTFLRWVAINAARMGKRVVFFSLEGLKEETLEAMDSCWTSTPLEDIEFGTLSPTKIKDIQKTLNGFLGLGGEIFVHSSESFDSMSIEQTRPIIADIEKIHGKVDMILFDYLELFTVGGLMHVKDSSGERRRREAIANKITDIGIEFKAVTGSATQANDIAPSLYENPDFYLTRHHIAEFKGVIKPFSYFITLNQTPDEKDAGVTRIYCDKFRKHMDGQLIRIYQRMDIGRFYDAKKTLEMFWNGKLNRKIR